MEGRRDAGQTNKGKRRAALAGDQMGGANNKVGNKKVGKIKNSS